MLPEKQQTNAGEIVEAAFQEVKPGPGKDYMCHNTIKTFLEKTSLDPLASDKRKQGDYLVSSASNFAPVNAKTWFGRGTMLFGSMMISRMFPGGSCGVVAAGGIREAAAAP